MIRVTVELVSAIHPSRSRVLGVMQITNDGTGTQSRCDYDAALLDKNGRPTRRSRVLGYPRKAVSMWNLVCLALGAVLEGCEADARRSQFIYWSGSRNTFRL